MQYVHRPEDLDAPGISVTDQETDAEAVRGARKHDRRRILRRGGGDMTADVFSAAEAAI
ncbi:hypothetical protein BH18ACT7_BH18ACT7_06780 [soil metagenome]|jgi:hypothetical protein